MYRITKTAAEMMKEMISEREDENLLLTICSSGVGCGGPTLKVDMRRALPDDIVETKDDLTINIRANIYKNLDGAEIDAEDTFWGKRVRIKTTYGCI